VIAACSAAVGPARNAIPRCCLSSGLRFAAVKPLCSAAALGGGGENGQSFKVLLFDEVLKCIKTNDFGGS
jgi:hypothetical protein